MHISIGASYHPVSVLSVRFLNLSDAVVDSGGLPDRVCTLTGTKEAVRRAMELIGQIIAKGSSIGNQPPPNPGAPGSIIEEMLIPGPKVGLVIGKGGDNLKQIQVCSGMQFLMFFLCFFVDLPVFD